MELINTIVYYINTIGVSIIIAGIVCCSVLYYFVKVKKVVSKVEKVNTSHFIREDAISYVPFQDLLYNGNIDKDGIIAITDTIFVGGLSVRGFDYASASAQERLDAELNCVSFFNVVDEPTTFRQSVSCVDLSENISEYEQIMKDIANELMVLDADYKDTLQASEEVIKKDPDSFVYYEKHLVELQEKIASKNHQLDECNALISYMKSMTKDSERQGANQGLRSSQILFSYEHNNDLYSTKLTREEIYEKAKEALDAKAKSYMDALAFCHFRASRLSLRDLIGLIRRHNFPLTGGDGRLEDLLDSSYTSLFVSSDSLIDAQKERIGEEEFFERLRVYEEEIKEALEKQKEALEQTKASLYDDSLMRAMKEM